MKPVPIKWAEAIAERVAADAVVVFAFKDGGFCATSYGATKEKCAATGRWVDDIGARLSSGSMPAPRLK